jgi:Zn-dependent peptidase ImmA (M78 family)
MNNKLTPKRYSRKEIQEKSDEFRAKFVLPIDIIPVPIEEIIEFKLGLSIDPVPGLVKHSDVKGYLSYNLQTIFVDQERYENPKFENRLRFTYAHEVGHFYLHPEEYKNLKISNPEEWYEFNRQLKENSSSLEWFEWQANEFAGQLLVPRDRLKTLLEGEKKNINHFRRTFPSQEELLLESVSTAICKHFGVSMETIKGIIRIDRIEF